MRTGALALLLAGGALAAAACGHRGEGSPGGAAPDRLAPLHAFEEERRRVADFARLPPSDRALGPDPIAVRAVPGATPPRFVGLLRGRDAIVLLDASLREIARAPAPASPTGLAVTAGGDVHVVGEQSSRIASYHVEGDTLVPALVPGPDGEIDLGPRALGLRDVAVDTTPGRAVVYAVDAREGRLFAIPLGHEPAAIKVVPACAGAFRVARAGDRLVVDCLLDHALAIFDLDAHGLPSDAPSATIRHDGPLWSFDAAPTVAGLLIAAGGVEDHPLDRTEGSFGYVDSFVFVYRLAPGAQKAEKLAEVNVSELGVITPKAILLRVDESGAAHVTVAGYGADRLAELTFAKDGGSKPAVAMRTILPGAASMAFTADGGLVVADPLLDAWFLVPPAPTPVPAPVPVPDAAPPRSSASRVGEALFFTNLMAPWNRAEGRLSRFTCETCHFEGYVDGRTHHTGRGDVRATTKPLLGLFNDRPYFSRALDPDLATMVDNELRVAGANSGHSPWFSASDTGLAWVPLLGAPPGELDALGLRRSLMAFLMDFTHRPNPAVLGRARFTGRERRGAEVFAARCERCHAARLVSDEAASRVAPDRWEAMVMSREGPIVWGAIGYHKTGVEPYVHELGARAPSLRRLYAKRPYFTNGSAKSLREVVERARWRGDGFWHDRAPEGAEGLTDEEQDEVLGFLELL